MITCGHCGVLFPRPPGRAGSHRLYCDIKCKRKVIEGRRTFALAFLKWAEKRLPLTVARTREQLGFS